MKKIILVMITIITFFVPDLFPQNQTLARKEIELYILTESLNIENQQHIFYKMESISSGVWENDSLRWIWNKTNNPKWINSTLPIDVPNNYIFQNTDFSNTWSWRGFDFVLGSEELNPDQPDFAYGFYKLSAFELDDDSHVNLLASVYLDYRDGNYPSASSPSIVDIFMKYNVIQNSFKIALNEYDAKKNINWINLENQSVCFIKNIAKLSDIQNTEGFPDFWQNCLAVIPEEESDANIYYTAHLIWGPKPNFNAAGYKVYRSINNSNNFELIHTISSSNLFEYIDDSSIHNSTDTSKYFYKVTAFNNTEETEATNIVAVQYLAPPPNITLTWENNYLKISWDRIDLGNIESYYIYKKVEGCEEVLARTEPQASGGDRQTWTDYSVTKPKRTDPMFKIDYRIRTKTTDGIFSNYSPKKGIYGNTGIWKKNIVEEEENDNYKLYQNTPNPFNPSTTISFTIPSSTEYYSVLQNVTLKVYDILGNEVATLVDENKPAGNYEVKFDGSNLAGGIYFYKLQSGSFAQTKKLLLLK